VGCEAWEAGWRCAVWRLEGVGVTRPRACALNGKPQQRVPTSEAGAYPGSPPLPSRLLPASPVCVAEPLQQEAARRLHPPVIAAPVLQAVGHKALVDVQPLPRADVPQTPLLDL
jgi:hypothetical protein